MFKALAALFTRVLTPCAASCLAVVPTAQVVHDAHREFGAKRVRGIEDGHREFLPVECIALRPVDRHHVWQDRRRLLTYVFMTHRVIVALAQRIDALEREPVNGFARGAAKKAKCSSRLSGSRQRRYVTFRVWPKVSMLPITTVVSDRTAKP